jgi:hypothetical protein
LTYGGQATLKPGVKPEDHTIIYTSDRPKLKPGEYLTNKALRMVPDNPRERLDPASRMNYAKLYTVEHNVKVYFIGQIHLKYERQLEDDYLRIHGFAGGHQDKTSTHPASSASMPRNTVPTTQYQQVQVATRPTFQVAVQPALQLVEQPQVEPHQYDETLYDADD